MTAPIPAHKLVPVEPTKAMAAAPANDRPGFSPYVAREIYAAMIAAAPAIPEAPADDAAERVRLVEEAKRLACISRVARTQQFIEACDAAIDALAALPTPPAQAAKGEAVRWEHRFGKSDWYPCPEAFYNAPEPGHEVRALGVIEPAPAENEVERLREIARDAADRATELQREVLRLRALATPAPQAGAAEVLPSLDAEAKALTAAYQQGHADALEQMRMQSFLSAPLGGNDIYGRPMTAAAVVPLMANGPAELPKAVVGSPYGWSRSDLEDLRDGLRAGYEESIDGHPSTTSDAADFIHDVLRHHAAEFHRASASVATAEPDFEALWRQCLTEAGSGPVPDFATRFGRAVLAAASVAGLAGVQAALLEEVLEFLEDHADTSDFDGDQQPNRAMTLAVELSSALAAQAASTRAGE